MTLWEIDIHSLGLDHERERVCDEFDLLTHGDRGGAIVKSTSRGYILQGPLEQKHVEIIRDQLLVDRVIEKALFVELDAGGSSLGAEKKSATITVLLKPGVMDPVAESIRAMIADMDLPVADVRTYRRYCISLQTNEVDREILCRKILANDAIERIVTGPIHGQHLDLGRPYSFRLKTVTLRGLDPQSLEDLSRAGQLALNRDEMRAIQAHYLGLDRDPTEVELETIAQTWSEHCSHKTLKGGIELTIQDGEVTSQRQYQNLLKETIFAATQELRHEFGSADWCVSVFADNSGVIRFDDNYHVSFKVETHNHPSAIEPYGGANTGLGGVIRDALGTGLGARPIANTDVFCFARPDFPPDELPPGVLHPLRIMKGVVTGVKDYGNRMGIPTVNGAVFFDDRYLANPLVYCGTVGLIPFDCCDKKVTPGELIVCLGGRTGRDGIHGATFSSLDLTTESETISGGAVQIGNAITEKKVQDVLIQARDRRLFTAVTDCGAGGFSSAIGEMSAETGALVRLDWIPVKYQGLSDTELWISESQERMVLSVPESNWNELETLCTREGVEATILGSFNSTGRLQLFYGTHQVADLDLDFLHNGRPQTSRTAIWKKSESNDTPAVVVPAGSNAPLDILLAILSSYSVSSKEWIIRQYDHEVQGSSVVKPLVGFQNDGPSDAAVLTPVLGSWRGIALGCGINPLYGDSDSEAMAENVIDEAIRNVVSVGADPTRIALLDNFCWGNVNDPYILGSLVVVAEMCRTMSLRLKTPFISGKDSLYNAYTQAGSTRSIPGTLLISALGLVQDVRKCVTMDLKKPGHDLYIIGFTTSGLGGSHFNLVMKRSGGRVSRNDSNNQREIFAAMHQAIREGMVQACHDLSEGGLAVAVAEMAFAGGVGATISHLDRLPAREHLDLYHRLFAETPSRFLIEARPDKRTELTALFSSLPFALIGQTTAENKLIIRDPAQEYIHTSLHKLHEAWQSPWRGFAKNI